jgi:HEAT repeat protein
MLQEQEFVTRTGVQRENIRQSHRIWTSFFVGGGITLIFAVCVLLGISLLNPFHVPGAIMGHLSPLLASLPIVLLVVLIALLASSLLTFFLIRPAGLIVYLRRVHKAQQHYHDLYTPLTALTNIRRALDEYEQGANAPTVTIQEEQVSILDLVQQQDAHQLILGVPGAGKTTALRVYQYSASQQPFDLAFRQKRIPVYVPMKNYSLYLKKVQPSPLDDMPEEPQATILDFLYESDLPGMRSLRPYVYRLAQQGRLLLLCDGLNEVDSNYLSQVSQELVGLMRTTENRLVMTCREVDYREQSEFVQLVDEGQAERVVIYPLQPEQVYEFVETYVTSQGKQWRHTAGQIMQVIDRSRLRYHCTNPMMLFTLMGIIDKIGVERGKQIDTRGRLLREYVKQLIEYEQQQAKWNRGAPQDLEVIRFLSEIACAARWANDRNAIQLRVSTSALVIGGEVRGGPGFVELADELQFWLDEHQAQGPFASAEGNPELPSEPYDDLALLLQFSLSAALIEISPSGVLSFRHELIAEYFVAEYFFTVNKKHSSVQIIREELLENVGRWSEPVAIWAGLLDNPLLLAERFGTLGSNNPAYVLQALALALVCVGVLWTPPQAEVQRTVLLPSSVEEALSIAVRNRAAREDLARIFTRCAEEGGQEVYRSLLPLIMVDGVDELLTLLDQNIVPELLFTQLQDAVDNVAYEAQVKRLVRVLARFGGTVVDRAVRLSQPAPERSIRLRAAAINILGGTSDVRAVEPLVSRLSDTEPFIVERATNALIRLGPELTLISVLREVENRSATPFRMRIHRAALTILGRFLDEQALLRKVTPMQYQRILDTLVPVLTSNYQSEPDVQQQAMQILVRQCRVVGANGAQNTRSEKVIEALLRYLPSQNEVAAHNVTRTLQEIGTPATPFLLGLLDQQSELLRTRVVEVFKTVHDDRALPRLLHLVHDTSLSVQQQMVDVLRFYAPESIPGLLDLVLTDTSSAVAERAAQILITIGNAVVEPLLAVLLDIVPERTRLLVQVLEKIHDTRSIPSLIPLVQMPRLEPLLAIAAIQALSQFPEEPRVVPPLLSVLSDTNPLLCEEGVNALSQLGEVAFNDLIAALDVPQELVVTQRIRRALLGMKPFPAEQLIQILEQASELLVQQILTLFKMQGAESAQVLVRHLLDRNEHIRDYAQQVLNDMPGPLVVPALLEGLSQTLLRRVITTIILQYSEAISPLVELLGEHERGDAAAAILPQFGPVILRPLISGLDDQRSAARERAQRILVALVRQSEDEPVVLHEIISLFNPRPPEQARNLLLSVLTNELVDVSIPPLLEGLEDAHLIEDVSEAFVSLARKAELLDEVLDVLLQSLSIDERRRGAEVALIKIGALAVPRVGEMIVHQNPAVARAAKLIMRDIGVPALPFIWNAHSDKNNPARRAAALEVFHNMPTEVIQDELVALLVSHRAEDISMAISLLLDRIQDEAQQSYADRIMIPELIDYVQTHGVEETNLRIIALLLLLGEHAIFDHLVQSLDDHPQHRKQLTYVLPLLGAETQKALLDVFSDPATSIDLRAELAAILGMMIAPEAVVEFAQNLSKYGGVSSTRTGVLSPDQFAISLRALGGLLAGGHWNTRKLQELRDASKEDSPLHELTSVLLGWRYTPLVTKLQEDLENEKDSHQKETAALTLRIITEQNRALAAEDELEKMSREHGFRGDELDDIKRDRDALRVSLEQATKEKNSLRATLDQAVKERNALNAQLKQAVKDNQAIRGQNPF